MQSFFLRSHAAGSAPTPVDLDALRARSNTTALTHEPIGSWELVHTHGSARTTPEDRFWRAFIFTQRPLRQSLLFPHAIEEKLGRASLDEATAILRELLRQHEEECICLVIHAHTGEWIAARDPLGLCPLYLVDDGTTLALTNTYRSLAPILPALAWDRETLADIALSGLPLDAERSAYIGLRRIPAGHLVVHRAAGTRVERWWKWELPDLQFPSWEEALREYRTRFALAVDARLDATPTILELSGGMDSSAVAAVASLSQHREGLRAINYLAQAGAPSPELAYARETAARLRIPLIEATPEETQTPISPAPYGNHSPSHPSTHLADGPLVVLTGQGGDPLFAVTPTDMNRLAAETPLREIPALIRLQKRLHHTLPPFFLRRRILGARLDRDTDERRVPWIGPEAHASAGARFRAASIQSMHRDPREGMTIQPYWGTFFEISDPGFTGEPLHYRFPFFDLPLIRFVASLPAAPYLYDKKIARDAWRERLPASVVERPKTVAGMQPSPPVIDGLVEILADARNTPVIATLLNLDELERFVKAPTRYPQWAHWSAHHALQLVTWFHGASNTTRAGTEDAAVHPKIL